MSFFPIGRSLWRSSCSKNSLFRGGGRSAVLNGGPLQTPRAASCPSGFDGKLGFLREYLVSVGPHKQFSSKTSLPDVNRILANPKLHQFFSSEAAEEKSKNYEDFCREEEMEIPKRDDQKSGSEASSTSSYSSSFPSSLRPRLRERSTMKLVTMSCLHFKPPPPQMQWAGSLYHAQAGKPPPPSLYQKPPAERTMLKIFRTLVSYFFTKENWKETALALTFVIAVKFFNIRMASYFSLAIDRLIKEFDQLESFLSVPDLTSLEHILLATPSAALIGYGGARIMYSFCDEWQRHTFFKVILKTTRSVNRKAFSHLYDLDLQLHLSRETGALKGVIDRGSNAIHFVLSSATSAVVPTLVEVCMVAYFMGKNLGAPFTLIASVSAAAQILFTLFLAQWINNSWKAMNEVDISVIVRSISSLINYENAKYFNNEAHELEKYNKLFERLEDTPDKRLQANALLLSGQLIIFIAALIACFYELAMDETITIGRMFLVNALLFQLFLPLKSLPDCGETLQSLVDVRSLFQLLEEKVYIKDKQDAKPLELKGGSILFDNVHFSYTKEQKVLDGISFEVLAGKTAAIVGISGSGKSTILGLLFRFLNVDFGRIMIDGQDIKDVTIKSLRNSIGIVPHDTVLINDTIYHNIHYGCLSATEEEVHEAARCAAIHDTIIALPKKYSTAVGEPGHKLSSGQKQQIAVARACLKASPIMLFEDATSALDSTTERKIIDAIAKKGTAVFVTSKLSTAMLCDDIILLENGRVAESGSHDELLKRNGRYAQMWRDQEWC